MWLLHVLHADCKEKVSGFISTDICTCALLSVQSCVTFVVSLSVCLSYPSPCQCVAMLAKKERKEEEEAIAGWPVLGLRCTVIRI